MLKIAILDDYAKIALQSADWSVLKGKAEIISFDRICRRTRRQRCCSPSTFSAQSASG